MAKFVTPGVYINEMSNPTPIVTQAGTSITVFIGHTEKAEENGSTLFQKPKRITSLGEFEMFFGNANTDSNKQFFLYESIQLFFDNGGVECYVISSGNYGYPVSLAGLQAGLEVARSLSFSILVIPDASCLQQSETFVLQQQMLYQCGTLRSGFAIIDTAGPSTNIDVDIETFRNGIGTENLKWGAAYYPWLINNSGKKIPPSGAIAGIYYQTDKSRGVWKAPANISVKGVSGVTNEITNAIQDKMNVHESGKSINAIRFFNGKGFLVWGARTLMGNDNEWRYIPVVRFFIMVEVSVSRSLETFFSEPNNATTWTKVKGMIENFLMLQWRAGALTGANTKQAFYVNVGLNQTMTQQDIIDGRLIVEVGLAVVRPAEFIILRIEQKVMPTE